MLRRLFFVFLLGFVAAGPAAAQLKIQSWTLDNGAKVLFVENHTIPVLDVSVEFDAGARRDPKGKIGLSALTKSMLAAGVRAADKEPALTEAAISDRFADVAAQFGASAGVDRAGLTLRTLSDPKEREASVGLLARVLAQPSFPAGLLARDKARTIANLKEELTQPESIASKALWAAMYGDHPYAEHPTPESVAGLTREDLLKFHGTHYVANRAVVAMIGAVSRDEADQIARQLTRRLPQGKPLPELQPVKVLPAAEEWIAHPASQAHVMLGMPAVERGDPAYFPLLVGNYTLGGGGFVSRLMFEIREKRGLAYSVYSYFNPLAQPGPFEAGLQTQKEQAGAALEVVRATIGEFLKTGPTQQELQAAKDNLIGGFALRIDNNRKILDNMAMIGFYGLPLDYLDTWSDKVAAVSVEDVQRAFKQHLGLSGLSTVVVAATRK